MGTRTLEHLTINLFAGTFGNASQEFITDRATRGLSLHTVKYYQTELDLFGRWLAGVGAVTLEDVTPEVIRRYLLELGTHRNRAGVHTAYRAIRAFFRWAWEEYEPAGRNPVERVKVASPPKEAKPGVELGAVQKMLAACLSSRDRALLLFLIDTGVRRRELLALNVGDVDFTQSAVMLTTTKNGKPRPVFMGTKAKKALRVYLRERAGLQDGAPLFATDEGGRLSQGGLREVIRRLANRAKVEPPGLHDFRRTFALEMLRGGADLVTVSRLLGHSSLEVTKLYLAQLPEDLQAAHSKAGPGDRLKV